MFCNQRVVTVAQPCEYTKNYWIIHSKWWILWYINYLNTTVIFLSEIMNNSQLIYLRRCFKDQIEVTIGVHVLNLKAVFIIHFPSLVSTTFNTLLLIYELHMWYFFLLVHISKPDNMSKCRASLPNNGKNRTARVLTPGSGLSSSNDLLWVSGEIVSWENGYKQHFGKSNKHIKHFPCNQLAATQRLIMCDAVQLGDVNPDQSVWWSKQRHHI